MTETEADAAIDALLGEQGIMGRPDIDPTSAEGMVLQDLADNIRAHVKRELQKGSVTHVKVTPGEKYTGTFTPPTEPWPEDEK